MLGPGAPTMLSSLRVQPRTMTGRQSEAAERAVLGPELAQRRAGSRRAGGRKAGEQRAEGKRAGGRRAGSRGRRAGDRGQDAWAR